MSYFKSLLLVLLAPLLLSPSISINAQPLTTSESSLNLETAAPIKSDYGSIDSRQFASSTAVSTLNAQVKESASPCTIVIFGGTGDLANRKLFPAIYNLMSANILPPNTIVVAIAREKLSEEWFRDKIRETIEKSSKKPIDIAYWDEFQKNLKYLAGSFDDDKIYEKLFGLLHEIDQEYSTGGNRLFYLSTAPSYFPLITEKLAQHHLVYKDNACWSKVIIEKPFGTDLKSAHALQEHIAKHLDENSTYYIDHFLGKEGVLNFLALRMKNSLFEPIWNNQYIDNIQITLSEDIGIGNRAFFWKQTGTLKDVFQNHMMQLLAITAMQLPSENTYEAIVQEKIKLLKSIRPFPSENLEDYFIRGQYGPGTLHGNKTLGYLEELHSSEEVNSETFIATTLFIDNDRWKGVPFYMRTGKRMPKQTTEITVTFKAPTSQEENVLFIRIQPNPGIFLKLNSKIPGILTSRLYQPGLQITPVLFGYAVDSYFKQPGREAYEKLLYDAIQGDKSLFVKSEEQLAAWELLDPVINYWKEHPDILPLKYSGGTWGPSEAQEMLLKRHHQWQLVED